MQALLYTTICRTDVEDLFGVGTSTVERWIRKGLPHKDGIFTLGQVCRWLKRQHKAELSRKADLTMLSQKELSNLLGVDRMSVAMWRRAGLRRTQKGYRLPDVLCFLRVYYKAAAKRKYDQKLEMTRKNVTRNAAQLHKFLAGGKVI